LTLEIEITETALVENIAVAQAIVDELRATGIRIALDDFGTGYSTLSQLLSFRLDKTKIDRGFVSRLNESNDAQIIVRAILGLAKGFGLTTTAEGIEDAVQLAYLKANGCTEGPGISVQQGRACGRCPGSSELHAVHLCRCLNWRRMAENLSAERPRWVLAV
jgi:EAL domain-containing protein (putative c-di-GMP-specific phosphodiesterase class I)